jgi:molybdopterin/thiamine biosynthesis adenylyltransferase
MSFDNDFDEELEPVTSKTPSSKTPSTGRKLTLYFMSTIGPGEKKEKLTVNDSNNVSDIKRTLGNLFGLNPDDFHLSSGGVTMEENNQLKDYSVNNGDDIIRALSPSIFLFFQLIIIIIVIILDKESDFFAKGMTAEERDLYDRQFRLEGWSQNLVKNSRVLIVGIGGLGCEIAKNLAMLGVGHLDLVDLDIIEHSNLNRQILFVDAKLGEPKAIVAANKLIKINPNITVKGYHTSLERLDPALYHAADVVIGGLDSMNARLNLNAQCIRFRKPLVDGGTSGYHGHMYSIFPYRNACYECNPLPIGESDDMAACTVVGIPRKRIHCLFKGDMTFKEKFDKDPNPKNIKDIEFIQKVANELVNKHNFLPEYTSDDIVKIIDRHDPGIITINAVISALESHEAVKILHWKRGHRSLGLPISSYVIFNGMTMKLYHIEKKRNPECSQCGKNVRRVAIKMKAQSPCTNIIRTLQKNGYELDPEFEPVVTLQDFNDIMVLDLEQNVSENGLRNYEFLTVVGFKGGDIYVTLKLKQKLNQK